MNPFTLARPVLEAFGVKATFFVIAGKANWVPRFVFKPCYAAGVNTASGSRSRFAYKPWHPKSTSDR